MHIESNISGAPAAEGCQVEPHTHIRELKETRVSADQNHVTISRAQVRNSLRSCVFLKLTARHMLVFD